MEPAISGALGFLSATATELFGFFKRRDEHRMKMEEIKTVTELEERKANIALEQLREKQNGEAFAASISAQGALTGSSKIVRDVLALFRPALTLLIFLATLVLSLVYQQTDAVFSIESFHGLMWTALGFWFGARSFDKTRSRPLPGVDKALK